MNNLQLYVGKDDCIRQIQEKFSELFPYLWISLFRHSDNSVPKKDILYTRETPIAEINLGLTEGKLEIDPHMTVSAFESAFYNHFGLFVQVSRKNALTISEKFGIDHFSLYEANLKVNEKSSGTNETILSRDVPYGC